jgi:flagellar basal-body rod protein FlgF
MVYAYLSPRHQFSIRSQPVDNGIYISLSRQMAAFRHMDVVANNIANANTTGFQAEKMLFDDYITRDDMAFTQDIATYHDTSQGRIKETGNPLDMAIAGDGYFVLELPNGKRAYTRGGNFQVDGNGVLATSEGVPVLDEGGQRIQFNQDDREIKVGENGVLTINGEDRGVIGMVEFANRQDLQQIGNTMFTTEKQVPLPAENSRMLHGVLEDSNVSAIGEIVNMTKVSRSVGNTAKYIEVMYDLQRKANNVYTKQG